VGSEQRKSACHRVIMRPLAISLLIPGRWWAVINKLKWAVMNCKQHISSMTLWSLLVSVLSMWTAYTASLSL
jgi:hypothetical protein